MASRYTFILIGSLAIIYPTLMTGQTESLSDLIEKSAGDNEQDQDYGEIAEELAGQAEKPVNLNNAGKEEMNKIPFLSQLQQNNLFDYLMTYGEVLSIYELQSVPGFDSTTIQKILPFISISPPSRTPAFTPKNLLRLGHHDLLLRYGQAFPKSIGFEPNDSIRQVNPEAYYLGSPQKYYFRYQFNWFGRIKIGFAGEKDPGEQVFRGAQTTGMDYYSAFLSIGELGILKNLIVGTFRISYGQGLTFGSGLALGSSPGFTSNPSAPASVRPSLGINEGNYLRGIAITLKIKRVEISGFTSYHPRDATVARIDSNNSESMGINSFITSGYHRTPTELAKRNAVRELICGGNINYSTAMNQQLGFRVGLTGVYHRYSADLVANDQPYNQFQFYGSRNLVLGFDFQLRYKRLYLFGEVSRSMNAGMAWLTGAVITPDPRLSITLIYRNYQLLYQNLFSNAFSQNGLNANECGVYISVNASVHPKLNFTGYLDLFRFPWLKYRVDASTHGQEFGAMAVWQASRNVSIGLRYYQKNIRGNGVSSTGQVVHKLADNTTRSYRITIGWLINPHFKLSTRIETREVKMSDFQRIFGYLLYQEGQFKPGKWIENITLRFSLFDIPDYAARIYVYEPEVLYGYSVPAYQGKGVRGCLVGKFRMGKQMDFWIKSGITCYTDRHEVGTGADLTKGNIRGDLTVQLMVSL